MSIENNKTELYNEIAQEFANTLIGDGTAILHDRDNNPSKTDAFHIITANCSGKILRVVNSKTIYPNWFLDPTKIQATGKYTISHYNFRKAILDVLKDKINQDHKIYVKYIIVNKDKKIFSIHFFHDRKNDKKNEIKKSLIIDNNWISHTTGDDCNYENKSIVHHTSKLPFKPFNDRKTIYKKYI